MTFYLFRRIETICKFLFKETASHSLFLNSKVDSLCRILVVKNPCQQNFFYSDSISGSSHNRSSHYYRLSSMQTHVVCVAGNSAVFYLHIDNDEITTNDRRTADDCKLNIDLALDEARRRQGRTFWCRIWCDRNEKDNGCYEYDHSRQFIYRQHLKGKLIQMTSEILKNRRPHACTL